MSDRVRVFKYLADESEGYLAAVVTKLEDVPAVTAALASPGWLVESDPAFDPYGTLMSWTREDKNFVRSQRADGQRYLDQMAALAAEAESEVEPVTRPLEAPGPWRVIGDQHVGRDNPAVEGGIEYVTTARGVPTRHSLSSAREHARHLNRKDAGR